MAGRPNPKDISFFPFGKHLSDEDRVNGNKSEKITGTVREKNKNKENNNVGVIDENKKQSILSLFSNVTNTSVGSSVAKVEAEKVETGKVNVGKEKEKEKETETEYKYVKAGLFTKSPLSQKGERKESGTSNVKKSFFDSNYDHTSACRNNTSDPKLMEENYLRKERTILTEHIFFNSEETDKTDDLLNKIKSGKIAKLNKHKDETTIQRPVQRPVQRPAKRPSKYRDFCYASDENLLKHYSSKDFIKDNVFVLESMVSKYSYKQQKEELAERPKKNKRAKKQEAKVEVGTESELEEILCCGKISEEDRNRKYPLPIGIHRFHNLVNQSVVKKKNICVPVRELNEKRLHEASVTKKKHVFRKHDKFDIFGKLGDDLFRYVLMYVKERKKLFNINKRFYVTLQFLRTKLIYNESLKCSISAESIIKTIYASHNIEILDLSGCSHITCHHFSTLANSNNIKFNRSLKILCLKNCNKLSDSSLKILIQRFRYLQVLDIRNCYKITYEGIYPLRYKKTLTKLYMGNMYSANVTNNHSNDTLKVLFGNMDVDTVQLDCPLSKLLCFEITYTKDLTDLSNLYYISQNLKILNLKGCSINDSASKFFKSFVYLMALNLAETQISNEVLAEVMTNCKSLKVLDISNTPNISNKTIVDLARNLLELRKVKIAHLS